MIVLTCKYRVEQNFYLKIKSRTAPVIGYKVASNKNLRKKQCKPLLLNWINKMINVNNKINNVNNKH